MKFITKEVYVTEEEYPSVGKQHIQRLRSEVANTPRGRLRLCGHKTNDDRMHEMFIVFTGDNYVRPSYHLGKDESLHVLEGDGDYIFFDAKGNVIDTVPLGTYFSGRQFYCRINENTHHGLYIRSGDVAIHETTPGPFRPEDTAFMPWAPEEADIVGIEAYKERASKLPRKERPLLKMKQEGEEVYVADEPIVSVGPKEIDFLKSKVNSTRRKRTRLCTHTNIQNTLHEMFVVYTSMTYVVPNKHLGKDESLHILEGEADFIFFDESGNDITGVIPLGDYNSGRQFYCRVPANAYHSMIMRTDKLVIHEATPGPFVRSDTVWAPWAVPESDTAGVAKFMDRLRAAGDAAAKH